MKRVTLQLHDDADVGDVLTAATMIRGVSMAITLEVPPAGNRFERLAELIGVEHDPDELGSVALLVDRVIEKLEGSKG